MKLFRLKILDALKKDLDKLKLKRKKKGQTNLIREHIPAFVSGAMPKTALFNSTEELLSIDFVKNKAESKSFKRFSITSRCLMVELNDDKTYFVVGWIEDTKNINLPKFCGPKEI